MAQNDRSIPRRAPVERDDSVASPAWTIHFGDGRTAVAVSAGPAVSGDEVVAALGLPTAPGVIVLNGGTSTLASEVETALRRALADGLATVAADEGLTVVTGGTDAGIFSLFGRALAPVRTAPCIGVAPLGRITWPGREKPAALARPDEEAVPLEPHHSHFVLVRAERWGDEIEAMFSLTASLSADCPSVAVLAGGGAGARNEALAHARQGRELIVLRGSGRFADELVQVLAGGPADDAATAEIAATAAVTAIDVTGPASALAEVVRARMAAGGTTEAR